LYNLVLDLLLYILCRLSEVKGVEQPCAR